MKIIEPSVELWKQDNPISHVARCARICYRKETGNDERLCNNLIKSKHWSMFRHETLYAIIPSNKVLFLWSEVMSQYMKCPYIHWINFDDKFYIVTNGNFLLDIKEENPVLYKWLIEYRVDTDTFEKEAKIPSIREMIRYTFRVTTQISTSRELNRVSPNNISEQSTRYVYEDGTLCRPHWIDSKTVYINSIGQVITVRDKEGNEIPKTLFYLLRTQDSFSAYRYLIDKFKLSKQDARGVLPLDTATVCAYTYSAKTWRHIIDLRYYGITGAAHPNAKIVAGMIREELIKLGYEFRD